LERGEVKKNEEVGYERNNKVRTKNLTKELAEKTKLRKIEDGNIGRKNRTYEHQTSIPPSCRL